MANYAGLTIDAEEMFGDVTPGGQIGVTDLSGVHVSLAGEDRTNGDEESGAEWRCTACGSALDSNGDDSGDFNTGVCDEAECEDDGCVMDHPHTPERVPLSWANSAGISLDEEQDTISVRISVGDPRGAFVMSVERMTFTDDDGVKRTELRLSVPTADDSWLHMPLSPLASAGYYRIGG